jgi:putative serine protease PepD
MTTTHPPSAGGPGAADGADTPPSPPPAPPKPRRARGWLAALAIGALLGGGAGAAVTTIMTDDEAPSATAPIRSDLSTSTDENGGSNEVTPMGDVEAVSAAVLPSVVSISVAGPAGQGTGTGVIISSDGEILTNNHVVEGAGNSGLVQVTFHDGTTAEAEVVGTDPLTDLAVIKATDVSGLTPAELGSSADVAVGQQVVAIGSPLGLEGTVTTGIISALDRPVVAGSAGSGQNSVINALQTDAPINPGNSGGPLVNMAGQVIGINSAIATTGSDSGSIGLGFSIPIDQAKPIAEELLENGTATHARLGVGVSTPQDGTRGALIASVESGSSAEDAGLQEGDIVTKVDDRIISDGTELVAAARSYRPGDTVTLTFLRNGEEQTAKVTLGSDADTT